MMKRKCLSLLLLLFSLGSVAQETGVITTEYCPADTSRHYVLYLPKDYQASKKYSLLLFLDPGARGNLPLEKYYPISDEQEIVIAGSLESKNFDADASVASITAILDDIPKRFSVDPLRVWLAGFSGGSRLASAYASTDRRVAGVIACGAGFSGEDGSVTIGNIPYAAIVGYRDMNFEEMLGITAQLDKERKENLLLLFNGGHDWPPVEQIAAAVLWLKKETSPLLADQLEREKFYLLASPLAAKKEGLHYLSQLQLSELGKIPSLSKRTDSLLRAYKHAKDQEAFERSIAEERLFIHKFLFQFTQYIYGGSGLMGSEELWKGQAALVDNLRKEKDIYKQLSGEREYDFSWRNCIENYQYLMQINQPANAYKAAYILSFFEPAQVSADWLMARAAAGFKDRSRCLDHFKKAIKSKKIDREKLLSYKPVTDLIGREEAEKLLAE
jgi:pimeloyl-ACP methyl ester carboxylesterase